jgi:uncharacterized protein with FMN-binding domain
MARKQNNQESDFVRQVKKFFLSAFVVITFIAYFFHQRNVNAAPASPVNTGASSNSQDTTANQGTANNTSSSSGSAPITTQPPQAAGFKNGTFTGPVANAYYGNVQVQVLIQNGKIANVTFLDYPHDRRTSQEINMQVMPWLTQEAIQAQSANVNLISGATLTSEAFANSLQSALNSASN